MEVATGWLPRLILREAGCRVRAVGAAVETLAMAVQGIVGSEITGPLGRCPDAAAPDIGQSSAAE